MKIVVEKAPARAAVKAGDVLNARDAAALMPWRGRRHVRRALNAVRFKGPPGYVFRCKFEQGDASLDASVAELIAEVRDHWLEEKKARGDPITRHVLQDMGYSKAEIAGMLMKRRP